MEVPKEISLDGSPYIWDGTRWYNAKTFLTPPTAALYKLDRLLMQALQEEDHSVSDIDNLHSRAREAEDALQYERAEMIARRLLKANRNHCAVAAVLCTALRAQNKPAEALKGTQALKDSEYAPLLVSRAAAFCDLGKWPEAESEIARAKAAGGGKSASLVARRIKDNTRDSKPGIRKKPRNT